MKKDAYYFSHDSNAKDDPKCSLLIEELGLEGYGIYWVLIETLRDQPDYRYPIKMIPILARKYNTTSAKVEVIVRNYGLFEVTNDEFFSISLLKRMEQKEAKSLKAKESVNQRWLRTKYENDTNVLPTLFDGNTIKERKVKEKKVKEIKTKGVFTPPSFVDFENYCKENGFLNIAQRAFKGYSENDWRDSKNNPVLNWKSKLQNVWFNDSNKDKPVEVKKDPLAPRPSSNPINPYDAFR